jgi:hypothetical protein
MDFGQMVKAAPEAVLHLASGRRHRRAHSVLLTGTIPCGGVVVDMRAHQRVHGCWRGAVRRHRRRAAVDRRPTRDAEARSCGDADGAGGRGHATASASNKHQTNFAQKFGRAGISSRPVPRRLRPMVN